MNRNLFSILALLGGAGCSALPSEPPRLVGLEPVLAVSDPPPPPADGVSPCEGVCTVENFLTLAFVQARYFSAPGSNFAFVTFSTSAPGFEISPNARVRDHGEGVIGTGTITATVLLHPSDPAPTPIIIDLSAASGSLALELIDGFRSFSFTATARFAVTGLPLGTPVLFLYILVTAP